MAYSKWKALCAELLEHATVAQAIAIGEGLWDGDEDEGLLARARAALAEPQGEPTLKQIYDLIDEIKAANLTQVELVRAALARWGSPAPLLTSLELQPLPVAAEALAARPLLEEVRRAIPDDRPSRLLTLGRRIDAWLRRNPPGQPIAIEPRGCPAPGACGCVVPAPPPITPRRQRR